MKPFLEHKICLKKMLFTDNNETNVEQLHYFLLCLLRAKLSLINFFDCSMKSEM